MAAHEMLLATAMDHGRASLPNHTSDKRQTYADGPRDGSSSMTSTVLRPFVRLALVAIVLGTMAAAQAQPKLEMHRVGVSADDGSGWHLAVSSKGSFSIRRAMRETG